MMIVSTLTAHLVGVGAALLMRYAVLQPPPKEVVRAWLFVAPHVARSQGWGVTLAGAGMYNCAALMAMRSCSCGGVPLVINI